MTTSVSAAASRMAPPQLSAFTMSAVAPLRTQREFAAALPRRPAPAELSVISFVQRGCRACRYASVQFRRLAEDRADAAAGVRDGVRFYEMDVDAAGALCADLGVQAVPPFISTPIVLGRTPASAY
eukprot:IDg2545t1